MEDRADTTTIEEQQVINHRGIAALLAHARQLLKLTEQIKGIVPARLGPHCRVANVRNATLVLQADTPAWASLLRLHGPAILAHLQGNGWPLLTKTKFLIGSPTEEPAPAPRPATLSQNALELLQREAKTCPDAELRAAWARLARHRTSNP